MNTLMRRCLLTLAPGGEPCLERTGFAKSAGSGASGVTV